MRAETGGLMSGAWRGSTASKPVTGSHSQRRGVRVGRLLSGLLKSPACSLPTLRGLTRLPPSSLAAAQAVVPPLSTSAATRVAAPSSTGQKSFLASAHSSSNYAHSFHPPA